MRGVRGVVVRVLALACVPLLIVTTPNVASAAAVEQSAGVEWDIGGLSIGGFGSLECDATVTTWTYADRSDIQVGGLDCYGGPDASPGFSQPGEPGSSFVVWVTGTDCGGSGAGVFDTGSEDSAWRVHGSYGGVGWTMGPPTCDPATLCLKVDGAGSIRQGCSPIDIAPAVPETVSGDCAAYTVAQPVVTEYGMPGYESDSYYWGVRVDLPVTWKAAHPNDRRRVFLEPIYEHRDYYGAGIYQTGWPDGTNTWKEASETAPGSGIYRASADWIREPSYGSRSSVTIVGVQVLTLMPDHATIGQGFGQAFGDDMGTTVASECWVYFGEKVAFIAGTDIDEPVGGLGGGAGTTAPVTPPYVPPTSTQEEGCQGFSFTDPTSWGGAASCMVVALLRSLVEDLGKLLGAVAGLAGDIVGGILAGLSALFVPDEMPSWSDIPSPLPTGWIPDMPSLGGAGCGGLTVPELSLGFNGWTVGPVTFADTCEDPWPLIRTFTYNGTLVLVLVSAVWMAFRAVASGLGMGVQGSGGGDDD